MPARGHWSGKGGGRGIISAVVISAVTGTILGRTEFKELTYLCVCMHINIFTRVLLIYTHKH